YHAAESSTQRRSRFTSGAGGRRSPPSMVRARVAKNIGAVTVQITMHQGHSAPMTKIVEIARKCTYPKAKAIPPSRAQRNQVGSCVPETIREPITPMIAKPPRPIAMFGIPSAEDCQVIITSPQEMKGFTSQA